MKSIYLFLIFLLPVFSYAQDVEWVKTEGQIMDITFHQGKKIRESAVIVFNLEDGTEQMGMTELYRIPFIGSMKSVGDKISIYYDKENPAIVQTVMGSFLSNYGMYILVFLGIIFSIKPFLKMRKRASKEG